MDNNLNSGGQWSKDNKWNTRVGLPVGKVEVYQHWWENPTHYGVSDGVKKECISKLVGSMVMSVMSVSLFEIIKGVLNTLPGCGLKYYDIWITSPSGKNYLIPIYQAVRIVRKHSGWRFTEVEPVKPELSRWGHFKKAAWFNKEG